MKILIVDDEENNLALLNRTLRCDFEVLQTTSPLEGLNILKENIDEIGLIISDHKMQEMDGVEFLRKSYELSPSCIRLLVTAYSDSQILIDAINYGKIYRYIKKPWEPSELLMVVRTAVEYNLLKKENDKLILDLKDLFTGTINAIIEALDAKDSFTLGRSRRVTFIALRIGKYFNLPMDEFGKIELAGLLHDIGMIGVPEDILGKTERLSPEDFEKIKKHVEHGVRILEDIKQLKEVVEVIKYHHEKFDGTGYPCGLKGDEIPLNAQIIAIADAYDSLTSTRSYRKGISQERAIQMLEQKIGTQFAPKVVEAFKAIIDDAMIEIKKYEEQKIETV